MKKIGVVLILISTVFIILSCTQEVEKHDVYVTVYPLKFVVEELFQNTEYTVDIVPGSTSHEYSAEWAPKEIIAMKDAEILYYIGANYDQYIDKKLTVFDDAHVEIILIEEQTDYIEYIPGVIHEHEHDDEEVTETDTTSLGLDPHFWISPKRMLDVLELIHTDLIDHFPSEKTVIDNNYIDLKSKLEELHLDFTETISQLTKPVLTSTNLYGYLTADYGLEVIPVSPGYHEEPDNMLPADSDHIIEEVLAHYITIIIYESNKTSPASDSIFSEMELWGLDPEKRQYNILQALPDEDINMNKDYISEMMVNLSILEEAGK